MGKKFKLSKLVLRRRPKKRGEYNVEPKERDPKRPSTQDERELTHPGWKGMQQLARGVVESDDEDETCLADEIPDSWGEIAFQNQRQQDEFKRRLDEARESFRRDRDPEVVQRVSDEMMSPHSIALDKVRDRLGEILDSHPEFLERLAYLIEPISNLDTDSIDEAGKMTRDDLVKLCQRNGMGKTWRDMLAVLNQLELARDGKLFQKK